MPFLIDFILKGKSGFAHAFPFFFNLYLCSRGTHDSPDYPGPFLGLDHSSIVRCMLDLFGGKLDKCSLLAILMKISLHNDIYGGRGRLWLEGVAFPGFEFWKVGK